MATAPAILNEFYEFTPLDDISLEDVIKIWKAMRLTFHEEAWARLEEDARKHFIVKNRKGEAYRYGKKPRTNAPLNQRPV